MPVEDQHRIQYYDGSSWNTLNTEKAVHTRSMTRIIEDLEFETDQSNYSNLSGGLEVRLQLYDEDTSSWRTWFHGHTVSKGDIKADGTVSVEAKGDGYRGMMKEVDIDLSSTDNVEIIRESFKNTDIDPDTTSWSLITPSVTLYSIDQYSNLERRSRVWSEMTSNYNWSLYLETEDEEIRYEPRGYYTSGETIDTSTDNAKITSWKPEIVNDRTMTNKVKVTYRDTNGDVQSETASDSTSINNYGEFYDRVKIPYIDSSAQAQDIANQKLNPEPGAKGKIEVYLYRSNLVNETISVKDTPRGIDDDFVVKEQINYYPEKRTVLKLGDIDRYQTYLAREGLELREERAEAINSASADVGGQDSGSLDTGSDKADVSTDVDVERAGSRGAGNPIGPWRDGITDDGTWNQLSNYVNAGTSDYLFGVYFVSFELGLNLGSGTSQSIDLKVRGYNQDTGDYYPDSDGISLIAGVQGENIQVVYPSTTVVIPKNFSGDTVKLEYYLDTDGLGTGFQYADYRWWEELDHDHPDTTSNTEPGHQEHGVSGQTASKTLDGIDIYDIIYTDR